jgi:hypothetical protein
MIKLFDYRESLGERFTIMDGNSQSRETDEERHLPQAISEIGWQPPSGRLLFTNNSPPSTNLTIRKVFKKSLSLN